MPLFVVTNTCISMQAGGPPIYNTKKINVAGTKKSTTNRAKIILGTSKRFQNACTKSLAHISHASAITMPSRFFLPGVLLIVLLLLYTASIPYASAHPYIEKTIPSAVQNGPIGTDTVTVFFSEAVDIEYSEIRVIDDKGSRIDNGDLRYHQEEEGEETSLSVSTPPLKDGIYTVSTKVLSKVDGHLVPGVFLFGVGDAAVDPELLAQTSSTELLLLPEAGAELPGMIGQTIIVGAVVGAMAVWGTKGRQFASKDETDALESAHYKRFMQLVGAGILLVLASNMLVIILQMIRLESGLVETIQTQFGLNWLVRMVVSMALAGVWFAANRATVAQSRLQAARWAMLAIGLALMMTSSLSGHGAATEEPEAVILDYIHNVVAGVWIGGIIYAVFGLLPALSKSSDTYREMFSISMIPRLSMIFIISIGIVIVTGPTLLWMLESDVGLITESLFGKLIILKVAIASVMVGMGALVQYRVQRRAESDMRSSKKTSVYKSLQKMLKVDVGLGVLLLVVVVLLTNGTLPAGEIRSTDAQEAPEKGFSVIEFSDNAVFDVMITPFNTGDNLITVSVYDTDGAGLEDLDKIKVKTSNPSAGIPPIEVIMSEVVSKPHTGSYPREPPLLPATYQGEMTLAFSGQWLVEVEAQRTQNANEAVRLDISAKPDLANLDVTVTEYMLLPNGTSPLHVAYDHSKGMWFTDASEPRLWRVDVDTSAITPHLFNGTASSFVTYNKHDGNIWFTDSRGGQIGYVDIRNGDITTIQTPDFEPHAPTPNPTNEKAMPFFIEAGDDGDIWLTIINKGLIARYQPQSGEFVVIPVPGQDTFPFALASGPDGMMWYTATGIGAVGYVNPADNKLTQVIGPEAGLVAPEALLFEGKAGSGGGGGGGGLWIAEHTGLAVTRYDLALGTIERHEVPNPDALPFGMAFDRYGNIWFAEHTVDAIGALDPHTGRIIQIDIPTQTSFVQFVESDDMGNIWFAEQRADRVGKISISERPSTYRVSDQSGEKASLDVRYADLVSPLMALGVLATSLFYIKAVNDKRRLDRALLLLGLGPDKQSP